MAANRFVTAACALLAAVAFAAEPAPKERELIFKSPEGKKAFEDGKKAFLEKKPKEAATLLAKAKGEAENQAAKEDVARYVEGLKGLMDFMKIQQKAKMDGGWTYENAQVKALVNINNAAGKLFRDLIEELEQTERKLVQKIEGFEGGGPYSEDKGKTFVFRAREPQYVVEGQRALRWECKNRECLVLKITNVPVDWTEYAYFAFWVYEESGKTSQLQVSVKTGAAAKAGPQKKTDKKKKEAPAPKAKAKSAKQTSFDGFQGVLEPQAGWRYAVFSLDKGLRRIGKGDLTSVEYIHIQIPQVKKFVAYIDDVVLVRKN